jgi:hypothetical protein
MVYASPPVRRPLSKAIGVLATLGVASACGARVSTSHGDDAGAPRISTGGSASSDPEELTCAKSCVAVSAIPYDAARGCFDSGKPAIVACDCSGPAMAGTSCYQRISDGKMWLTSLASLDQPDLWRECPPAVMLAPLSCDFAHCRFPPSSTCDVESTCNVLKCGALVYDVDGCQMLYCKTDGDCDGSQRCVTGACEDTTCYPAPDGCHCIDFDVCRGNTIKVCNAVEKYGPRGTFTGLSIVSNGNPCPGTGCGHEYDVSPDGTVTMDPAITTHVDPVALAAIIDGPELRAALRDGIDCGTIADATVMLSLQLADNTWSREVAACAFSQTDNVVKRLYDLITSGL